MTRTSPRKMIRETIDVTHEVDRYPLSDVISLLTGAFERYGDTAYLFIDGEDGYGIAYITFEREETEEEAECRLQSTRAQDVYERNTYERLKKKFEGQPS